MQRHHAQSFDFPRLVQLPTNIDDRGALTAIEAGIDMPFDLNRCYLLHHLSAARGGHAHKETYQLVVSAAGSCQVCLSPDGIQKKTFELNTPTQGLLIAPMTWIELPVFSSDALILVLASTHYESSKVIRDWDVFVNMVC